MLTYCCVSHITVSSTAQVSSPGRARYSGRVVARIPATSMLPISRAITAAQMLRMTFFSDMKNAPFCCSDLSLQKTMSKKCRSVAFFRNFLRLRSVYDTGQTRRGGLFMGRRKLELVFGAVSGAVGLLVALYTAVIATKE